MSECIAMVIGVILGAVCVICTMKLFSVDASSATRGSEDSPRREGFESGRGSSEEERVKKQWENFLNYDGSDKDQMSIGDE